MTTGRPGWGLVGTTACLLTAAVLGGCATGTTVRDVLDGRTFLLDSAEGFTPVQGTTVRLSFDGDQLSFYAGCNHHSGTYTLRDGHLLVTTLSSTDIGCAPDLAAQDTFLAAFFGEGPRFRLLGDELRLATFDADLMFLDREVADPDRALTDNVWSIDSMIDGESVSSVAVSTLPTILFRDDGTLTITSTCNSSDGNYSVSGDRIALSNIAFTERGCPGTAEATVEAHIQSVIADGLITFTIEAARLTLERGPIGLSATTH